ncbi:MAG: phytanoyl-CoA dioxygenase family protein [Geminicoccaceae bacterium]
MDQRVPVGNHVWLDEQACDLSDFRTKVERETTAKTVPLADEIASRIPIYESANVRAALSDDRWIRDYMAEWNGVFSKGPGIVVFRGAYEDLGLIDDVTGVLNGIIERERDEMAGSGDHFAAAGANSRVWNAHEKLCMASPELFARYNANHVIDLISRSWLGPLYHVTTQVNVVHPGGKAQTCHRDYHMGFQAIDKLTGYPAPIHALSAMLTLQGAIAHCDMSVETGPTKLLPYSQTYLPGYLATQLPEFRAYFEEHHAQMPLKKGDALFFNPAVFHAAGDNVTEDISRIANLMQIGSGYGRSIEIVDRTRMSRALYPTLAKLKVDGALKPDEIENVIAACAEGYPFPANLDIDSPLSGMAPESQQELVRRALDQGWDTEKFERELQEQADRKRSH